MPHERLQAVAGKLRAKAKRRRSKRRKEQSKAAAERRAERKRIERNEPEGAVERAKATAKQAKEVGSATREFAGETKVGSIAGTLARKGKQAASSATDAAAGAADALEPPDEGDGMSLQAPSDDAMGDFGGVSAPEGPIGDPLDDPEADRTVVVGDETTIVDPAAAAFSNELGGVFDDVGTADTDGVIKPKDVRVSEDLNNNGEFDTGETFRPVGAPDALADVPSSVDPDDDMGGILIDVEGDG